MGGFASGLLARGARVLLLPLLLGPFFSEARSAAPQVLSTAPAEGDTGVVLGAGLCVTFSTAMDAATTEAAFSVLPATAGTFSWSGPTLTFTPAADLSPSTSYQVVIGAAAQDSLGNPLGTPFTLNFDTGTVSGTPLPPGVIKTLIRLGPGESDGIVGLQSSEFQTLLDPLLLGGQGREYLQQPVDGRPAPLAGIATTQPLVWTALTDGNGDGVWDDFMGGVYISYAALYVVVPTPRQASIVAQFSEALTVWLDGNPAPVFDSVSPSPAFALAQGVHVIVIRHAAGSAASYSLKFTDELGADLSDLRYSLDDVIPPRVYSEFPAQGASGVSAGTDVVIGFSEAMDTTVPASTVATITGGTATGTWMWTDAFTLVWTPAAALDPATLYTVSFVAANTKDLRGLSMSGPFSTSFTTAPVSTPAVTSVAPSHAASGASAVHIALLGSGFAQGDVVHPPGALPMNGHYYRLSTTWDSWDVARTSCLAAGGHLVTLESNPEDDYVWRLGGKVNAWIGLSNAFGPGNWQTWATGEPVGYTNWAPGEPNNFLGLGEHWASYWYAFVWNDITDGGRRYVCEFDTAASPSVRLAHAGQPDINATNVVFTSSGSLFFDVNLSGAVPGAWDVIVTNPDGAVSILSGGFVIDPPPPFVTNVTSTTADGTYGPGAVIIVTVQFSDTVVVTGAPCLQLETGATDHAVPYVSGSGTSLLSFSYTVVAGDASSDLDYLSTTALSANGGTIRDIQNADATLTLPTPGAAGSLGANKNIQIVTPPAPTVTNVSSTSANGTYGAGQVLTLTVQFSQAVTVTGTPQLTLATGPVNEVAVYSSGSGTNTLQFQYTVAAGDNTGDLDYGSTSALSANGGAIRTSGTTDAILTLPPPGSAGSLGFNKDIQIVTSVPPTVTNVSSTAPDGTYGEGNSLTITVTFSQPVTVTGAPLLVLETGAVDTAAVYASGSGTATLRFTYVVAPMDSSSDLDYVGAGALGLNGGSIQNGFGSDALLTLPAPGAGGSLGANKNIVIFTASPSATPGATTVNITAGGCGLTGAEAAVLLAALALIRRRLRNAIR